MFRGILVHISVWMLHGVVHGSLGALESREQHAADKLITIYNESEHSYAKLSMRTANPTPEDTVEATASPSHSLEYDIDFLEQHAQLQSPIRELDLPGTAMGISDELEESQLQNYMFAIPAPELCTYLRISTSRSNKRPLSDYMDCPSQTSIVWDINPPSKSQTVYYEVSKNLTVSSKLNKSKRAANARCCVIAQTKYINRILAHKQANTAISEQDSELQGLYKETGMDMRNLAIGKELRLQFGVQLLIAGLYSHITKDIALALHNISVNDAALLICYMLDSNHVERFPKFASALYYFLCKGKPSRKTVEAAVTQILLEWWRLINMFSPTVRADLYRSAVNAAARHTIDACTAGFVAEDGVQGYSQYAPQLSVYWHAVFMAVSFAATATDSQKPSDTPSEEECGITELILYPASCTAPWDYWKLLLFRIRLILSKTEFNAFIITRTPAALVGELLQSAVVGSQVRQVLSAFWLVLQTAHAYSALEALPAIMESSNFKYLCYMIMKLPADTLAQMSCESSGKILQFLVSRIGNDVHTQQADPAYGQKSKNGVAPSSGRGSRDNKRRGKSVRSRRQASSGSVKKAAGRVATAGRATRSAAERAQMKKNKVAPLSKHYASAALCRLLLLHRSANDLSEDTINHLFTNTATTCYVLSLINDMASEKPLCGRLSRILRQARHIDDSCYGLLEILGNPCDEGEAGRHRDAAVSDQTMKQQSRTHDFSWEMHENGRRHLQALSPFFFRQVLPRLAEFVSSNMHSMRLHQHVKALTHLLGVSWFREGMAGLKGALAQIGAEIQGDALCVQRWAAESQRITGGGALQQDGAVPTEETHYLVHKERADMVLPLSLAELRVKALLPESSLTVHAYIAIIASLERLAIAVLNSPNYYCKELSHVDNTQLLLERIASFNAIENPFVALPAAEVKTLREGVSTDRWMQELRVLSRVQCADMLMFKVAMCSVCYCYLQVLANYKKDRTAMHLNNVYTWTTIFQWLYSHPMAQYYVGRAVTTAEEICRVNIFELNKQIAVIQSDFIKFTTNRPVNAGANLPYLEHCLRNLCIALEGSKEVFRRNRESALGPGNLSNKLGPPPKKLKVVS